MNFVPVDAAVDKRFYIYIYSMCEDDIDGSAIFYVGKGTRSRAYCHLRPSYLRRHEPLYAKLRKLLSVGLRPVIEILVDQLTEAESLEFERRLIALLGRRVRGTGRLCNLTAGGLGNAGWCPTTVTRAKIGATSRRRFWPLVQRQKASHSHRGKHCTAQTRERMSAAKKGRLPYPLALEVLECHRKRTQVESFDLGTGVTVKQYASVMAATFDGYARSSIQAVLAGQRYSCAKLGWRKW